MACAEWAWWCADHQSYGIDYIKVKVKEQSQTAWISDWSNKITQFLTADTLLQKFCYFVITPVANNLSKHTCDLQITTMGLCHSILGECHLDIPLLHSSRSREEKSRNQQMEWDMREDFNKEKQIVKILLLGAAHSGKTTILKQMKLLHRMQHRWAVQQLCITCKSVKETGTAVRGGYWWVGSIISYVFLQEEGWVQSQTILGRIR